MGNRTNKDADQNVYVIYKSDDYYFYTIRGNMPRAKSGTPVRILRHHKRIIDANTMVTTVRGPRKKANRGLIRWNRVTSMESRLDDKLCFSNQQGSVYVHLRLVRVGNSTDYVVSDIKTGGFEHGYYQYNKSLRAIFMGNNKKQKPQSLSVSHFGMF